jgi:hypothetical protein
MREPVSLLHLHSAGPETRAKTRTDARTEAG